MKEIRKQRQECMKVFDLEDGNNGRRLIAKRTPMHYRDRKGNWRTINTNILDGKVNRCGYNVRLLDGEVGYTGVDPNGKKIELKLTDISYVDPIINKNTALYKDVESGVDFELTFTNFSIQAKRILKNKNSNKTGKYLSIREPGANGKLLNLGEDAEGRNTKLTVSEEITTKPNQRLITQVFDDMVMKMNPATRKREWSSEVAYPVVIDPTSTFVIGANADDGFAVGTDSGAGTTFVAPWNTTGVFNTSSFDQVFNSLYANFSASTFKANKSGAYQRFLISNIPQSSTITSATLKLYIHNGRTGGPSSNFEVKATDQSNPAAPTTGAGVITPVSPIAGGVTVTPSTTTVASTNKAGYLLNNISVTTMVQNLVNKYDYSSSKAMLFFNNTSQFLTTGVPTLPALTPMLVYDQQWGNTKDAELVIDYVGQPTAKTHFDLSTETSA